MDNNTNNYTELLAQTLDLMSQLDELLPDCPLQPTLEYLGNVLGCVQSGEIVVGSEGFLIPDDLALDL